MSPAQFALLVALVGERGCISVVGDDDQAIYGFQVCYFHDKPHNRSQIPALMIASYWIVGNFNS